MAARLGGRLFATIAATVGTVAILADDAKAAFKSKEDPRYRAILAAIGQGKAALLSRPRVDMPGAVPIPQDRDFGRTY